MDTDKGLAICEYCGATILIDEEVQHIGVKELEEARREVEKTTEKPKPANQNMFRAV